MMTTNNPATSAPRAMVKVHVDLLHALLQFPESVKITHVNGLRQGYVEMHLEGEGLPQKDGDQMPEITADYEAVGDSGKFVGWRLA